MSVSIPHRTQVRASLAMLLATSALLGGGVSAAVLIATGAVDTGAQTTTVVRPGGDGTTPVSATGLNADALYASTAAGVVDITSKGVSSAGAQPASPFGGPPQSGTTATGTGFVIDSSGNIVTAAHVVDGASSITVTLEDGTTHPATLVNKDDATDVALLKIDASGMTLHPLKLGSSGSLGVGDQVAAIGDPFGYQRSISTGIVSGVDRTVDAPNGFTVAHAIQTDAALNPGNSGGPLLNASGEVIGIVDQIATNGGADQSAGVGFAVPIDLVTSELSTLKSGDTVTHAYLGVATSGSSTTPGATLGERDIGRTRGRRGTAQRRRGHEARRREDRERQRPGRRDREPPSGRQGGRDGGAQLEHGSAHGHARHAAGSEQLRRVVRSRPPGSPRCSSGLRSASATGCHAIVNRVVNDPFKALSHPIRRGIVERLAAGPATVGDATGGFGVSKPAISKHLKVLEETGVVTRVVEGRTHRLSLDPDVLSEAADWMDRQRALWGRLFDVVDEYLKEEGSQ